MLRSMITGAALAMAVVTAPQASGNREAADAPGSIRPLLIGASVPDLVLKSSEGRPFDVAEAIRRKPTVLILYRGGW